MTGGGESYNVRWKKFQMYGSHDFFGWSGFHRPRILHLTLISYHSHALSRGRIRLEHRTAPDVHRGSLRTAHVSTRLKWTLT